MEWSKHLELLSFVSFNLQKLKWSDDIYIITLARTCYETNDGTHEKHSYDR